MNTIIARDTIISWPCIYRFFMYYLPAPNFLLTNMNPPIYPPCVRYCLIEVLHAYIASCSDILFLYLVESWPHKINDSIAAR